MKRYHNPLARYYALAGVFVLICLVYVFRLAGFQIFGASEMFAPVSETTERTVKIQALRGDICDRNGKVLVTTKRSYDLTFNYLAMPDTKAEVNHVILSAIKTLEDTGNSDKRVSDSFPFEGTYPNLIYTEEARDHDSAIYSKLQKVIKLNEWQEKISADDFIARFVKKHKLNATGDDGKPLFTDAEIDAIIRVRYDMELTQFSYMQPYTLARGLDLGFVSTLGEQGLRGIVFDVSAEREYLYPGYASHILGRVGKITADNKEYYDSLGYSYDAVVGISGCEYAFEEYLHGTDGELTVIEDRDGNVIDSYISREPIAGNNVYLTIDIDLQIAAEDGLKKNVERYSVIDGKKSGAIVASDPNTGKVLALASYPTYDLSTFNEDYYLLRDNTAAPLTNRALNGLYAPGSTFKIAVAYAALEEGTVTGSTVFPCDGIYTKYSGKNGPKCWIYAPDYDYGTHGDQTIADAIINSCNCYFYEVGDRLGIDRMNYYCKKLGFGSLTGIELGEAKGILAGVDYVEQNGLGMWYPGDTLAAAIGQSYNSFTPLGLNFGISTVISGGKRYEAQLLDSVHAFDGTLIYEKEPNLIDTVEMSAGTLSLIRNAMKEMVESNSTVSYYMSDVGATVCAKTGTAQTGTFYDDALFTSFAPFDDPELAVTCVIERGVSGANASMAAAEVYKEYFSKNS